MLSPESANASPIKQHDPTDDGIREPSEFTVDTTSSNCTVDADVMSGVGSIDYRLRQSNMSVLSRYKVCIQWTGARCTRCHVTTLGNLLSKALRLKLLIIPVIISALRCYFTVPLY